MRKIGVYLTVKEEVERFELLGAKKIVKGFADGGPIFLRFRLSESD
jgi:hypothetical protein